MSAVAVKQTIYLVLSKYSSVVAVRFWNDCSLPEHCGIERAVMLVNRYWRDILGAQPHSTIEARTFLIDDCPFEEWVGLFERGVVPEIMRCQLVCPT